MRPEKQGLFNNSGAICGTRWPIPTDIYKTILTWGYICVLLNYNNLDEVAEMLGEIILPHWVHGNAFSGITDSVHRKSWDHFKENISTTSAKKVF